jgi:hypothetical protein
MAIVDFVSTVVKPLLADTVLGYGRDIQTE